MISVAHWGDLSKRYTFVIIVIINNEIKSHRTTLYTPPSRKFDGGLLSKKYLKMVPDTALGHPNLYSLLSTRIFEYVPYPIRNYDTV